MFLAQLKNELWKLFGKKRTYIGFAMLLLAENGVSFALYRTHFSMQKRLLESNGFTADFYASALTTALIVLAPIAPLLLPLYVALIGGDLVAKEAEDGTLRMMLCRPVSRVRLLVVKWCAGAVFSAVLVAALGILGVLCARLWFPWGGMFAFDPEDQVFSVFSAGDGLERYALAMSLMLAEAFSIMGVAFMFSCFNVKPAAATILALSILLLDFICYHIPYFQDYRAWFFTYHARVWVCMFWEHIPWWRVGESLVILAGLNLTFLVVGCAVFQVRDIKS
ncbi:MAG TPA: ABC transporter permease subunit [Verrucomicrobiae bacterium]